MKTIFCLFALLTATALMTAAPDNKSKNDGKPGDSGTSIAAPARTSRTRAVVGVTQATRGKTPSAACSRPLRK